MDERPDWIKRYHSELMHYGVKGMKWGVRRTKEQLGHRKKGNKVANMVYGHKPAPKKARPFDVIDHVNPKTNKVDSRSFYDENGLKWKDIHNDDHGNRKQHAYGTSGEHVVLYWWNEDGTLKKKISRELLKWERKENGDIL